MSRRIIQLIFGHVWTPSQTPTEKRLARYARTDQAGSDERLSWTPQQLRMMTRAHIASMVQRKGEERTKSVLVKAIAKAKGVQA